jgi:hypothetical protein
MDCPILVQLIDDELRWREAELALIKAQLRREMQNASHFPASYRIFVAITYAHFEGFTKVIFAQALDDVARCGALPSACTEDVQVALFSAQARKAIQLLSNVDLVRNIKSGSSFIDSLVFPPGESVLEISNLGVVNLWGLLQKLGIDRAKFSSFRKYVGRLVDLRHSCAHGERLTFDSSKTNSELAADVFELQSEIVTLMHAVALEIIDIVERDAFVVSGVPTAISPAA